MWASGEWRRLTVDLVRFAALLTIPIEFPAPGHPQPGVRRPNNRGQIRGAAGSHADTTGPAVDDEAALAEGHQDIRSVAVDFHLRGHMAPAP